MVVIGRGPVALCGEELVIALHDICNPIVLCGKRFILALRHVRGKFSLWQGAHYCSQHSRHSWQEVIVAVIGKRLIVSLISEHALLSVPAVLALGTVHAVFGILTVLAFGNVYVFGNAHTISSIHAVLGLDGVFPLLIVPLQDMVVVASCEQQHENLIVFWELYSSFPCIHCFIVVTTHNTT